MSYSNIKAFFFDRDGVLTKPVYRYDEEHKRFMDGASLSVQETVIELHAKDIIAHVRKKGFKPIIITNQPDFIKRDILLRVYEDINKKICKILELKREDVFECLHKDGVSLECGCRKPKPNLIYMAQGVHKLDLSNSWFVGDSWVDIVAAKSAGIPNTIFLRRETIEGAQEGNVSSYEKLINIGIKPKYIINSLVEIKDIVA